MCPYEGPYGLDSTWGLQVWREGASGFQVFGVGRLFLGGAVPLTLAASLSGLSGDMLRSLAITRFLGLSGAGFRVG